MNMSDRELEAVDLSSASSNLLPLILLAFKAAPVPEGSGQGVANTLPTIKNLGISLVRMVLYATHNQYFSHLHFEEVTNKGHLSRDCCLIEHVELPWKHLTADWEPNDPDLGYLHHMACKWPGTCCALVDAGAAKSRRDC
jgi:hypothetical protein